MLVEIVKWGNSTAVRLPAAILKQVRVALGDRVGVIDEGLSGICFVSGDSGSIAEPEPSSR